MDGFVFLPFLNQSYMLLRSKVCPSQVRTGSFMISMLMGQTKSWGMGTRSDYSIIIIMNIKNEN